MGGQRPQPADKTTSPLGVVEVPRLWPSAEVDSLPTVSADQDMDYADRREPERDEHEGENDGMHAVPPPGSSHSSSTQAS